MNDRFQDLRTYVAVVQGRGFAVAGERLGLVKSAVSRRVSELEERLGTRLLHRTTRAISVTDAGNEFYWRAVRILADLDEAESLASSGAQDIRGRVRVTAPAAFVNHWFAGVAGELLQRYPNLALELHAADAITDMVAGGYDLALRVGALEDSSLIARRIGTLQYVYVATPAFLETHGQPSSAEELGSFRRVSHLNCDAVGDNIRISQPNGARLVIDSEEGLLTAVLAGGGIALLPLYMAGRFLDTAALSRVLPDRQRSLHALFPSNRNIPSKVRAIVDFIMARLAVDDLAGAAPATVSRAGVLSD